MSEENVEQVRARYEQSARGDFTPIEKTPDDFEFVASTNVPDAGTYRGEAARRWMKAWVESFDGLTMEATEIIDVGDKVFAAFVQRGRPRGGQTEVESRWWSFDTFREGVSAQTQIFADRAEALEAAGLSE
jgi:ketosteroid isomerase-like protein